MKTKFECDACDDGFGKCILVTNTETNPDKCPFNLDDEAKWIKSIDVHN